MANTRDSASFESGNSAPFKSISKSVSSKFHPVRRTEENPIRRPIPLRAWFSAIVLVYISLLIGGLEYCLRTFPKETDRRSIPKDSEPEAFGPFYTAPLAKGAELDPSSAPISKHSSVRSYVNSTNPATTTSRLPDPTSISWESFKSQEAVVFGNRTGVPGFKAADFAAQFNASTSLRRRVPPPEQWGNLPGQVQLVLFDAYWGEGTVDGPGEPDVMYIWAYISYLYDPDPSVMKEINDDQRGIYCSAVCDGPALVFLDSRCWDNWILQSGRFATLLEERPGAVPTLSESAEHEGTACPAIVTASTASPMSTTVLSPELPHTQTENLPAKPTGTRNAEAPEPTTGPIATSAVPDAFLLTTTIVQTDNQGRPTATITTILMAALATGSMPTAAVGDVFFITTVLVQTDGQGHPTASITTTLTATRVTGTAANPAVSDVFLIPTTIVKTDRQGRPTATIATTMTATRATFTLGNPIGFPTSTITTALIMEVNTVEFTDSSGVPTSTSFYTKYLIPTTIFNTATRDETSGPMSSFEPYHKQQATLITLETRQSTLTYKNRYGEPTATVSTTIINWPTARPEPEGPIKVDFNGVQGKEGPPSTHPLTWKEYLLASFTPVLLTLPLSILLQIQSSNLKPVLPFYALTKRRPNREGATAAESLCLVTTGLRGMLTSLRLLFVAGEPISLLSDLHVLASSLAVSFSSEALGIKLYGHCQAGDFRGCRMGVAIFETPGRVVQAFLSLNLLISLVIFGFLRLHPDWKRAVDVYARQGCGGLSGTSSMLASQQTRVYFLKIAARFPQDHRQSVSNKDMVRRLGGHSFSLQPFAGRQKLSTVLAPTAGAGSYHYCLVVTPLHEKTKKKPNKSHHKRPASLPRISLPPDQQDLVIQLAFFLALVGFLILLLYYELTTTPSAFEHFMNSQSMGVRTLFTCIGLVVSLAWDCRFTDAVTKEPYHRILQARPSHTQESFSNSDSDATPCLPIDMMDHDTNLGPTSTSPLSVLFARKIWKWPTNTNRKQLAASELVILTTAIATILAKITPVLLANVPYSPWLTWRTHQACMWSVVGILVVMMLVIVHSAGFGLLLARRRSLDVEGPQKRANLNLNLGTLAGRVCLLFVAF